MGGVMSSLLVVDAIKPGRCSCTCAGGDLNPWHCFKAATGCGWTRTAPKPKPDRRLFCAGRHVLGAGFQGRPTDHHFCDPAWPGDGISVTRPGDGISATGSDRHLRSTPTAQPSLPASGDRDAMRQSRTTRYASEPTSPDLRREGQKT
jgi:hypothetical protein